MSLLAHTGSAKRNGFSPLGERSFSGTFEHRRLTPPRRLNAALCLPERRELRLPSVNMSAWIFHPRCGRRRHASFAPLSCMLHRTSILLRRPPRINSVCRLLSHFPFLWNSIFDFFPPLRKSHSGNLGEKIYRRSYEAVERSKMKNRIKLNRILKIDFLAHFLYQDINL